MCINEKEYGTLLQDVWSRRQIYIPENIPETTKLTLIVIYKSMGELVSFSASLCLYRLPLGHVHLQSLDHKQSTMTLNGTETLDIYYIYL